MNTSKIKKTAIKCLQNNWKKVVLFIFCYILVKYIVNRIFLPLSKNDITYNSIDNILIKIFNINENTANKIKYEINSIANISLNTILGESVNYGIISLVENIFTISNNIIIVLILFFIKTIIEISLSYAFTISLMKLKREENIGIFSFLENNNLQFKRALTIEFRRIGKLIIPIILIIITYIMLAGDYIEILRSHRFMQSMLFYDKYSASMTKYTIKFVIDICLVIISTIYYYIQNLKYILSFKIAYDNSELSAKEVVEKSKTLMMGHRKEYFILKLSFIGWEILSYFTLGIGYLWLIPYIQVSTVCFYDNLKEAQQIN